MKILVTGSTGYVGTCLVDLLCATGNQVIGLDLKYPLLTNSGVHFQQCDITDKHQLVALVQQCAPDAIIHLAAQTNLNERGVNSYAANTTGVENLVEAIRATETVKRAIFTSTQLVCRVGYVPKSDMDYAPTTLYGESKVLTERIVREHDGGGVEWCLVRPTTVWGPGMKGHYRRFLKMIQRGRYFHVGSRPLFKSYAYVENMSYQYLQILKAPTSQIHGRVFYLADYEPLSLRAWADAFQREFGAPSIPICPELIARMAARIGDIINTFGFKEYPFNSFRLNNVLTEYQFDLRETQAVCGPLPFTVDQGVKATVKWIEALIEEKPTEQY